MKQNEWSQLAAASLEQTSELPIVEDMADLLKQPSGHTAPRPPVDALAIHLMGEKLPVLIRKGVTVLGRTSTSELGRAFDLSNYYARVLGVSREHAVIRYTDEGWAAEDLGSTNGTWVNNTKLTPKEPHRLRSGDTIRLGQLTMFVYFQ